MAKTHQAEGILGVLRALDVFGNAIDRADLAEHLQRRLVGAAMRRAPQAGDAGGDAGKRIGAGRAGQPHGRGRGVLLVVGMQREDAIHGAGQDRIGLVVLARHGKAHPQEVRRVIELVVGIHERLADRIFVGHRRQRRHFGDHADRGDHPLRRIGDVGGVVIERGERADRADHHRHRMGVAAKTLEEPAHLLVDHRVMDHAIDEVRFLAGGRQFAVKQEVAGLEEIAVFGEIGDRIAAIEQDAFVAVDIGDLGFAARRRGEAGIVSEDAGLGVELADVQHLGTDGAVVDGKTVGLVADFQRAGFDVGAGLRVHDLDPRVTTGWGGRAGPYQPMRLGRCGSPGIIAVAQPRVHCKIIACELGGRAERANFVQIDIKRHGAFTRRPTARLGALAVPPDRQAAPGFPPCPAR